VTRELRYFVLLCVLFGSIYIGYLLVLLYPQVERFFAYYTNGAMFAALGMVAKGSHINEEHKLKISQAHKGKHYGGRPFGYHQSEETKRKIGLAHKGKTISFEHRLKISLARKGKNTAWKGHNHGLCRKCGQVHNNSGMTGKHHSTETKEKISKAHSGHSPTPETRLKMSLVKKGKSLSLSHYAHLVEANKSQSKRDAISLSMRGRVSPNKGNHYTLAQRLQISEGLRKSKCWLKNVRAYHIEKNRAEVRAWYGLSEDVLFFPVTLHEHKFVRLVLLNGRPSSGLMTQSGMCEIPEGIVVPLLVK